ncbi:venom metalloproteinase 3-like [Leptopilina heterotoma]|uniref:venom metalloproteinase 3-like n=1 Tax=Leptopilina heterotoma TaxID=63436 RepID=UPI001CA95776|nr:venom metalloproteinase 3-like [Leptopilina heterotoma]
MIYSCAILLGIITTLSQTYEIQHHLNGTVTPDLQHASLNETSNFEVTSVEHSFHKENTTELKIKIKINGTDREIILQSSKFYLASKDTKVWLAEKRENKFDYTLQKDIIEKANVTFYHDEETKSTISHTVNKRGISEFRGIIDFDKVILPIDKYIHNRHSNILSETFQKSEKDKDKNHHIIYKRFATTFNKDKIAPSKSDVPMENLTFSTPDVVYPEILVYVDKTLFHEFDNDIVKSVAYILTFWNGVDLIFRDIEKPLVRLNIAGIVLCQESVVSKSKFLEDYLNEINEFQTFMYKEEKFRLEKDYDIAVLMGGGPGTGGPLGVTRQGGACTEYTDLKMVLSVMMIHDSGFFYGIHTATHELSHLFGASHDGDPAPDFIDGSGAETCSNNDSFLLGFSTHNENKNIFSPCTKRMMSHFFSLERAKCLLNNPAVNRSDKQILRILPGKYVTIDEQCQKLGYLEAVKNFPLNCFTIKCKDTDSNWFIDEMALDGTACDLEKFCWKGKCVKVTFNENDNAKLLFPPKYQLPANKSADELVNLL